MSKKKEWKGYTLEEIASRRAINQLKIEIEKERLHSTFSPDSRTFALLSQVDRVAEIAQSSFKVFTSVKKIISIVKSFKE